MTMINNHQSTHIIQDLIWAVRSAPLMILSGQSSQWYDSAFYEDLYQKSSDWFTALKNEPEQIQTLVDAQKDKRLGKYFETLWAAFLNASERFEIVEQNLQIIDGGKTLGEFDLIVVDLKTKKMLHLELAVKFYLGIGDTGKWKNWFGPAKKDRLDLKMNHLINHQTILSQQARARKVLREKNIKIDQSAVILKGCLFYPDTIKNHKTPQYVNVDHCHRRWVRLSELSKNVVSGDELYPLIGQGWMADLNLSDTENTHALAELLRLIDNKTYHLPLLLSIRHKGLEVEKLFVVQNNWHNQ